MKQHSKCHSTDQQPVSVTRRTFLREVPLLTMGAVSSPVALAVQPEEEKPQWSMLIDVGRCIGCQACTIACIHENEVPDGSFRTVVSTYNVTQATGASQAAGTYVLPRLCNHCDTPPCIPVCPVSATFKRDDGLVLVDAERCVGCAYCVQACPYDARFINHDTGKADKCTFCGHRLEAGLLPACVETCVGGARIFGNFNNPESELYQRIKAAGNNLKVLKPEADTKPRVFYIGLDEHFQGKVQGDGVLWKPRLQGA